jgi:uncharacterized protein
MFKRFFPLIAFSSLALLSTPSLAVTSFDCKDATTKGTKLVCNNKKLSSLDDMLFNAYGEFIKIVNTLKDEDQNRIFGSFKQGHINWINDELAPCQTAKCVEAVYTQRIAEFYKAAGRLDMQIQEAKTNSAPEPVVQPESVPFIKPEIRARYKHMGGIEYCENDKDYLCNVIESVYEYNSQEKHHFAFIQYLLLHKAYLQNLNPQQKGYEHLIKHNEKYRNLLNKNPTLKTSGKTLFQNAQNEAIRIGGSLNLTPDRVEAINFFSNFQ